MCEVKENILVGLAIAWSRKTSPGEVKKAPVRGAAVLMETGYLQKGFIDKEREKTKMSPVVLH